MKKLTEDDFKEYLKEEADEIMDLIYIKTKGGFNIGLDFHYMDKVGNFKIELPTGEVIDTANLKEY